MFIETQKNNTERSYSQQPSLREGEQQVPRQKNSMGVRGRSKRGKKWLFVLVLLLVVGVLGYWWRPIFSSLPRLPFFGGDVYHAVFLENGDVYFGKLSKKGSPFVLLRDAYYLKVSEQSQKTQDGKQISVPDLKLIKIGGEFHKPTDEIELERGHILFIQELQDDSAVIKVIDEHKDSSR